MSPSSFPSFRRACNFLSIGQLLREGHGFSRYVRKSSRGFWISSRTTRSMNSKSRWHNSPGEALHNKERSVTLWPPVPEMSKITHIYTHTHAQTHTRTHVHIHAHTHIHTHTYTHTCTPTHTPHHTHTHPHTYTHGYTDTQNTSVNLCNTYMRFSTRPLRCSCDVRCLMFPYLGESHMQCWTSGHTSSAFLPSLRPSSGPFGCWQTCSSLQSMHL